jgi:NADPH:quinone reductase
MTHLLVQNRNDAGRLVSIVDTETSQSLIEAWGKNLTIHFVLTPQYRAKLDALTKLIERTQLRPVIDSTLSWDQIIQAHQRLERGGTQGKIVLEFSECGQPWFHSDSRLRSSLGTQ